MSHQPGFLEVAGILFIVLLVTAAIAAVARFLIKYCDHKRDVEWDIKRLQDDVAILYKEVGKK